MPDVDFLTVVVDYGDDPEAVPAYIENRVRVRVISRPESLPHVAEDGEVRSADNPVPRLQRRLGGRVDIPEILQRFLCDHVHGQIQYIAICDI